MKTILVKLLYTTPSGFEWLEETVEVSELNYIEVVDEYLKRNQQKADALETKWQLDGEDVYLFPDANPVEIGFCPLCDELFKKVFTYITNI